MIERPEIRLTLLLTDDERSSRFSGFADSLRAAQIVFERKTAGSDRLPAVLIGENLRYSVIPGERELAPFLAAVLAFGGRPLKLPESLQERIRAIDRPARLKLHIAERCGVCPGRVRQIVPLALLNNLIELEVVDAALFPEIAAADGVQGVPTLILDNTLRWTGMTPLEEIIDFLSSRDPAALGASSIEEMLRYGNADQIAQIILQKGKLPAVLSGFLADEKFSTRLGAMVALEEVAKRNPRLASQASVSLWERFPDASDQVKEDILFMLGKSGGPEAVGLLENALNDHLSEPLREAAAEALAGVRRRIAFPPLEKGN